MSASEEILLVYTRCVVVCYSQATEPVTSQILTAFFGYCGNIQRLLLDHDSKRAIVLFENDDSAQTALLLNNGTVCGGPIQVKPIDVDKDIHLVRKLHLIENDIELAKDKKKVDDIDTDRAVFVSNVSEHATIETLSEFFSFCGTVERIQLLQDPTNAPNYVALVTFETSEALDTALLLEGAKVHDLPITVVAYDNQIAINHEFKVIKDETVNTTGKGKSSSTQERVAAMKAAGYDVGQRASARAKAFDEKYSIQLRATNAANSVKASAREGVMYGKSAIKLTRQWWSGKKK